MDDDTGKKSMPDRPTTADNVFRYVQRIMGWAWFLYMFYIDSSQGIDWTELGWVNTGVKASFYTFAGGLGVGATKSEWIDMIKSVTSGVERILTAWRSK